MSLDHVFGPVRHRATDSLTPSSGILASQPTFGFASIRLDLFLRPASGGEKDLLRTTGNVRILHSSRLALTSQRRISDLARGLMTTLSGA
jgi:hypothetical protein